MLRMRTGIQIAGIMQKDNCYVGHGTKSLIFSGVIYFNVHITLNTQVPARELCRSVSADAAIFCYYGAVNN